MMVERVALVGAGEIAKQVLGHLSTAGTFTVAGLFDDQMEAGTDIKGSRVLGNTDSIRAFYEKGAFDKLLVAVGFGDMNRRNAIFKKADTGIPFASFVHPRSFVDPSSVIGRNVIIYPGCVIDVDSTIADNVLINSGCIVSHNCSVGENVFFGPGVIMSGYCSIGGSSFIGTGTTLRDSVSIGSGCRIGAGSLIVKDVPDNCFGYGLPFKEKKPSS